MRIVDDDPERLACGDGFETAGNLAQFLDATDNSIQRNAQSDANTDSGAQIKKVGLAHQGRTDFDLADWRFKHGVSGIPAELVAYRIDIGSNLHAITNH